MPANWGCCVWDLSPPICHVPRIRSPPITFQLLGLYQFHILCTFIFLPLWSHLVPHALTSNCSLLPQVHSWQLVSETHGCTFWISPSKMPTQNLYSRQPYLFSTSQTHLIYFPLECSTSFSLYSSFPNPAQSSTSSFGRCFPLLPCVQWNCFWKTRWL